ncbi:electron transport complex subunit RsxD [Enterobacteriaceae bacterium LUAb1]
MAFRIAGSPYTHHHRTTGNIMLIVLLATIPGMIAQWYYFGWGTLIQLVMAIITALSCESIVLILRHQPLKAHLNDHSALLTAVLLGISLPPLAPWWLVIIGTSFAIIIAKHLYGGLGHNLFNPAMVGYVVLLISFPLHMTRWLPPDTLQTIQPDLMDALRVVFSQHTQAGDSLQQLQQGVDGITQATPLDGFKTGLRAGHTARQLLTQPIYSGILAGLGWQSVNLCYLAGGIFLLYYRAIRWHIPVAMLASLAFFSTAGWLLSPETLPSPLIHLFSGATMLGAFFIATDPVTASTTNKGRLIFGAFIGMLVWLIRSFGGYPDGVAFAVLLANITVPLLDYYTQPPVYGHRKE